MRAIVGFHGRSEHLLARFLEPGFQHCLVAVLDEQGPNGGYWIEIDPRGGTPAVRVMAGGEYDLAKHYNDLKISTVETTTRDRLPVYPFCYANCVGIVKAILGIRNPMILTPYQLWRHLTCKS